MHYEFQNRASIQGPYELNQHSVHYLKQMTTLIKSDLIIQLIRLGYLQVLKDGTCTNYIEFIYKFNLEL